MWINTNETAANGIDDDANGYVDDIYGYNFASNIASPMPQNWPSNPGGEAHGTHVAGLSAARANNNVGGAGVMGTNVKIMSLNVFGATESASLANIINAINYAVNNGADVINLSLGGYGSSTTLRQALQNAANNNVTVLASAGNDAVTLTDSLFIIPASYASSIAGMISVGSSDDHTGNISSFSNRSTSYVEVAAPGSHSLNGGLKATLPGNTYGYKQGTSMAAPVASGVVAWAYAILRAKNVTPTSSMVEDFIMESSTSVQSLSPYIKGGKRVNLLSLLDTINTCFP